MHYHDFEQTELQPRLICRVSDEFSSQFDLQDEDFVDDDPVRSSEVTKIVGTTTGPVVLIYAVYHPGTRQIADVMLDCQEKHRFIASLPPALAANVACVGYALVPDDDIANCYDVGSAEVVEDICDEVSAIFDMSKLRQGYRSTRQLH